ncbi:Leucine Rich repeats (2 copies) [Gimesia alba]|uniref:Leucine Rich repeats (2 copies) n=1 Tax=Gimesia alba TaxID=2527973 RepID=A0A517RKN3_9PLAN|nr:hypothetical protein [Gimesia alba]QDT44440.1 Leucine Rich repeats (2 copies) [Gimesia alba]
MNLKRQRFNKWHVLLALLLCGGASALFFKEDQLSLAKEQLKAKGFTVKPSYRRRRNPIDSSIHDLKGLLKIEEIEVYRSVWYKEQEALEVTAELEILAPYIDHLSCGTTKIRDCDAPIIGKMHQLKHLELYGPDLSNRGVSHLCNLKDLEWFVLDAPQVTDEGLNWLHQCHQLWWLILPDAKITGTTLKQISNTSELLTLDISNTLVESSDLHYLTELPKLRRLILTGTQIDDSAGRYFKEMTGLSSLVLKQTKVGDDFCQQLTVLPKLESLELDDTSITDQGVQTLLAGCPELKRLSIRNCNISGKAFTAVKSRPIKLEQLSVTGTKLTGEEIFNILNDHESLESIGYNSKNIDPQIVKQINSIREARLHRSLYGQ